MIDVYKYKIANEKAEVLYDVMTKLDELTTAAAGLDDQALQQAVTAYINNMQGLVVSALQVDGDMDANVSFDADTNAMHFTIPEGRVGADGDKPIVTFALDADGNLSYEVTYTNAVADGIGAY